MESREVTKRREMVINFIKTIIEELPPHIEKYPSDDQLLLSEFRELIKTCINKGNLPRAILSKEIETYLNDCNNSNLRFTLPFLWFSVAFFTNANLILSVSGFHPDDFFEYLLQNLRGKTEVKGVFSLVRTTTPLSDLLWENLQYACLRIFPLSSNEVNILEIVASEIPNSGIDSLNKLKIKKLINQQLNEADKKKNITKFFKLLSCRWYLLFNPTSFGLESVYVHLQLIGKGSRDLQIAKIFNVQDPRNTTLAYSYIFAAREHKNEFLGLFMVPSGATKKLEAYLENLVQKNQISLKGLSRLTNQRISTSLNLYVAGKGWKDVTEVQWRQALSLLRNPNLRTSLNNYNFSLSSPFQSWNYENHRLASKFISLYCRSPISFSYDNLPFKNPDKNVTRFSQVDIGLIKLLLKKRALIITFIPDHLHIEYSLDHYWIILPEEISITQLSGILELLPICRIIYTNSKQYLWVLLKPRLVEWIKRDLEWDIIPINPFYYPNKSVCWFDFKTHQWKIPEDITSI
jgi:hypothetical protein